MSPRKCPSLCTNELLLHGTAGVVLISRVENKCINHVNLCKHQNHDLFGQSIKYPECSGCFFLERPHVSGEKVSKIGWFSWPDPCNWWLREKLIIERAGLSIYLCFFGTYKNRWHLEFSLLNCANCGPRHLLTGCFGFHIYAFITRVLCMIRLIPVAATRWIRDNKKPFGIALFLILLALLFGCLFHGTFSLTHDLLRMRCSYFA